MVSFSNQVVLITGAGSGLGRALAVNLANEGAIIAAVDLHPEPLASLAAELKDRKVAWAVADVINRTALRAAVGLLQNQLGPIDILIANAGIGFFTSALDFQVEAVEAHVRVNLMGVVNSIDAVLPGMLARRRGRLVGISSIASFRGIPGMAGYCAAKAGMNAFLDAFRVELKPQGIGVTTVCPGWIRTPMTANLDVPLPNLLEVADAARRIVKAIRQGREFCAFPASSARSFRLLRWLPCKQSDWLLSRMIRSLARK